jgi:hypothetical protein
VHLLEKWGTHLLVNKFSASAQFCSLFVFRPLLLEEAVIRGSNFECPVK